jgi:hypothetical protein
MMIEDDDILFLSDGGPFLQPKFKEDKEKINTISANLITKRNSLEMIGPFIVGEIIGKRC